jgi:hypothetical protein
MSVGFHLVINDGNPQGLFHGAFMVRLLAASLEIVYLVCRNPVLLPRYETLQINNPCSINSRLTLIALVLPT